MAQQVHRVVDADADDHCRDHRPADIEAETRQPHATQQHHHRQRTSPPLQVPVTAIFSRRDGVVAWQACIDQINQSVEHVEVTSSHLGLGFDPRVYSLIARRLAT